MPGTHPRRYPHCERRRHKRTNRSCRLETSLMRGYRNVCIRQGLAMCPLYISQNTNFSMLRFTQGADSITIFSRPKRELQGFGARRRELLRVLKDDKENRVSY